MRWGACALLFRILAEAVEPVHEEGRGEVALELACTNSRRRAERTKPRASIHVYYKRFLDDASLKDREER